MARSGRRERLSHRHDAPACAGDGMPAPAANVAGPSGAWSTPARVVVPGTRTHRGHHTCDQQAVVDGLGPPRRRDPGAFSGMADRCGPIYYAALRCPSPTSPGRRYRGPADAQQDAHDRRRPRHRTGHPDPPLPPRRAGGRVGVHHARGRGRVPAPGRCCSRAARIPSCCCDWPRRHSGRHASRSR